MPTLARTKHLSVHLSFQIGYQIACSRADTISNNKSKRLEIFHKKIVLKIELNKNRLYKISYIKMM